MTERKCGACQLCCSVMPVLELDKGANVKCQHQRFRKGCAIYGARPLSCKIWSCGWLAYPELAGAARPDMAGYVVDPTDDFLNIEWHGGGSTDVRIIQIWCDPKRPESHRDPELRGYLSAMFARGFLGVVRFGSEEGLALCPPEWTGEGWVEIKTKPDSCEHTTEEYLRRFSGRSGNPLRPKLPSGEAKGF
jgi:hypothetical protein